MAANPPERLREVLAEIHQRWGSDALRPLSAVRVSSTRIPTSFAALDALLDGGIPCGRAAELSGVPTSGMTTLAFKIIAEAQTQGRPVVYLDLAHVFDPDYAARCGVRLDSLLIARPEDVSSGLDILQLVAIEAGAGLAVIGSTAEVVAASRGQAMLNAALRRVSPALRQSGCTALFLSPGAPRPTSISDAALRLHVENMGWIEQERDVSGLRARVTILKSQRHRPARQVEIALTLDDSAQKDAA